jgi:hypothetical protein
MRSHFAIDELLTLKDAGLVAASAAATVSGAAQIVDLGGGMVEGHVLIELTAIEIDGARAQGVLTLDTNPTDGNTMTIGTTVYRFKDTPAQAEDIQLGTGDEALADTQASIVATINGTGTAGTDYYAGTTSPHPLVRAAAFGTNKCVLTALHAGLAGNAIATTETFTAETNVFDDDTLGAARAGTAANEKYDIVLQGSNSATFASGIVALARIAVGTAALVDTSADTSTGRIILPFRTEFMGTIYRYVRAYTVVSGTDVATGINYNARIVKRN